MTWIDYTEARKLTQDDPPFHALIMAAMRKADTNNLARLRLVFPDVWVELQRRYQSPGALLPDDPDGVVIHVAEGFDMTLGELRELVEERCPPAGIERERVL